MDILEFREFCLSLPLAEETTPFDEDTLVYKIGGKMFVYTSIADFTWAGVKCDPEMLVDFSERYEGISPAPHMNKKHWMCMDMCGTLSGEFIRERLVDSYKLVVENMTKAKKTEIKVAVNSVSSGFFDI